MINEQNKINFSNNRIENSKSFDTINDVDKEQIAKNLEAAYLEDIDFQLELEEQILEEFSKTKNFNLKETLIELRQSGEEVLRNTSSKIIEIFNSNKLAVALRDKYIEKRGHKIYKELSVDNKLSSAEDYDSFLKTISSDFWGNSKNGDDAIYEANKALVSIASKFPQKSNFLENTDNLSDEYWSGARDVLSVWPKLLSKGDSNRRTRDDLGSYLNRTVNLPNYYSSESKELTAKYVKSNDDFIALKALSTLSLETIETDFPGETLLRIDSIINKFPNSKNFPREIQNLLISTAYENPDEFLSNSRRTELIFNLWLNDLERSQDNDFKILMPLLVNRIAACSEEETKKILKHLDWYWVQGNDSNWLLNVLPIEKNNLKAFKEKAKESQKGSHIIALKEAELSREKISDETFNDILNSNRYIRSGSELILVSSLIIKYPNDNLGMSAEKIGQILDSLKERNEGCFDIEKAQALSELMNKNNWSDDLKEKVFSLVNTNGRLSFKILDSGGEGKYSWVKNEPALWHQLQINFHEGAQQNELRHYFYEVLDGKRESDNLDHLIKSYAASQSHLDFEELRSLFIDNKIDKKYIKYFINKVYVTDVLSGLENNSVNIDDKQFILESLIKNGQAENSIQALEKLFSLETYQSPEKRKEILGLMSKNIISSIDNRKSSYESYSLNNITADIFNDRAYQQKFLSDEEIGCLGKGVLEEALQMKDDYRLSLVTLKYPDKIREFFPSIDENDEIIGEREEYLTKLFERLIPNNSNNAYHVITKAYFSGLDLDIRDEKTRLKIENKFLELRALDATDFIDCFNDLNEEQAENFLNYFEKNSAVNQNQLNGINNICQCLTTNKSKGLKRVYLKLLNDKNLHSSQATILFKEDIVFGDDDIRNAFFSNINNWPEVDGTAILEAAARRRDQETLKEKDGETKESFSLSPEEIKTISTAVISNRGLSPRFWRNYLASGGKNGDFYLDKNLFEIGLERIGEDCFSEKAEDIVSFLESIKDSEFELRERDMEYILRWSFKGNCGRRASNCEERLEVFYHYRPDLMEKIMIGDDKDSYYSQIFETIFKSDIDYSSNFKDKAIDYLFNNKSHKHGDLLTYLKKKNDQETINKFKESAERCEDAAYKLNARLSLLTHDLLSVDESKSLYQEMTSSSKDNVRTQILNSIDIIGSMLSNRNNIDQLGNFLDNPKPEHIEGLQQMSDFVEKYSKENKGRSIIVMLFAREYLPGRSIEEVIERVSASLRKYNEIIDRNSYKNIPDGFRASIGMEYEITSSTAEGYQKLTEQASLKNDIARLSNAARIGYGKDAVHEIATRPTDNPYLMLLEMKLLQDIEYIDFNFSRSEDYQKGARGFHLTIGGEKGIPVNQESNFLQNAILAASWGGVQAGESGHRVNGGRGVSLRGRSADGANNNIQFFSKPTESVELRSLSIDKQETFQRAVTTAFNGAIAIQAFRECFPGGSENALKMMDEDNGEEYLRNIINSKPEKVAQIANLWVDLISRVGRAVKDHESFLDRERFGYLDDDNVWVDPDDFGGEYNQKRFQSIIENIDPTLSLDEYLKTTEIDQSELFKSFSIQLSDKLIKINNLYLKPGTSSASKEGKESRVFKGDHANAISMLKVTKLNNDSLEYYGDEFLDNTIFDMAGEKRSGYYALQGGSELMFTHAVQKALLDFNSKIEKIVN